MSTYTLQRDIPIEDSYDVLVAGGGPAGCAAAAAAAREGVKTLLIEATGSLGGMGTSGLVPWFCGYHDREKIIAKGLAERILNECRDGTPHLKKALEKNPLSAPAIDPELLKRIYDNMVTGAGARVLFGSQVCAVEKSDDRTLDTIVVSNKSGLAAYQAKVFVDCTGDGDLAAWAGSRFEKGDEEDRMQPATHCFAITNIDEYGLANGPGIHQYDPHSPIHKAVLSEKYPLIIERHSCLMRIGPRTYGFNTGHVFDVDNTDPVNLSDALIHGRKMADEYQRAFAEFLPSFANSFLVATGSLLGVRETRRIMGDYVLNAKDYHAQKSFPDEICRTAYGIDVHGSKEKAVAYAKMSIEEVKRANNKQTQHYGPGESLGVPYRCLVPKELNNVLVAGRCISTDRPVNGTTRIMACCLNTGEAAGMAAAMASKENADVRAVNTDGLRARLKEEGAYLP